MCTRAFNNIPQTPFTTGRNMDWAELMDTSMYYFPSGLTKSGVASDDKVGTEPETWTSDYASVVAMVGGIAASDGMNSAGLVANVLYQSESEYVPEDARKGKKALSAIRWVQYVLDKFSTVQQVVDKFNDGTLVITPASVPDASNPEDQKEALLHLSVSDLEGNSAIIEILDGKIVISESPEYRVMTNDPNFEKQQQLNEYWKWQWNTDDNKHPSDTLPGSAFSPDRFARADYYVNHLKKADSEQLAVAQMFSILSASSVPLGYEPSPEEPNISQTLWATVASQNNLNYYYKDMFTPNTYWTNISEEGVENFPTIEEGKDCLFLPNQEDGMYLYYSGEANGDYLSANDPFAG